MNRIRALIVDDEALARRRLAMMLTEEHDVEVIGEADGGSAAVEAIVSRRPDLVFLDVQMPGLHGFGVLRCTAGAHRPVVVFVTAYDEHAIRAFEVNATDYLLKPVTAARLHEAVRRAVERVRNAAPGQNDRNIDNLLARVADPRALSERISVRNEAGTVFVSLVDINWVEADGDHLRLHAGTTVHTLRETMADVEARLRPFRFVRVHRSSIVNVAAVTAVEPIAKGDYYLVLRDGTRVRSGRQYRSEVQSLLR